MEQKKKCERIEVYPKYWEYVEETTKLQMTLIRVVSDYLPLWAQLFLRRLALRLPSQTTDENGTTVLRNAVELYHGGPARRLSLPDTGKCGLTEEQLCLSEPPTLIVYKMLAHERQGYFVSTGPNMHDRRECDEVAPVVRLYFAPRFARGSLSDDVVTTEKQLWEDCKFRHKKFIAGMQQKPFTGMTKEEIRQSSTTLIDHDTQESLIDDIRLFCTGHNDPSPNSKCENVSRFILSIQFRASDTPFFKHHWSVRFHLQCRECDTCPNSINAKSGGNEWTYWDYFLRTFGLNHITHDLLGPRVASFA